MLLGIQRKKDRGLGNHEMFVTRKGALERRDAARTGSRALHVLEDCCYAPLAALPAPGLAGQPPTLGRAAPGKRGTLFRDHYCAHGETPGPWRHRAAARSPTGPELAEQTVAGEQVSHAYAHLF